MPNMLEIELDCPPGYPRPDDLIDGVFKDICELTDKERAAVSRVFGNWMFRVYSKDRDFTEDDKLLVKGRVQDLYNRGRIRYGSWELIQGAIDPDLEDSDDDS